MTRRKLLALLAFLALISAVYAVADRRARRIHAEKAEVHIDWDAVVDDPAEKLEISLMSVPRYPTAQEGTWIENRLEAAFNVDFKPQFTSHFAYMRRRPLVFAGGNVPDLFYAGDPVVVQKDAHHGYALPIPYRIIIEHAPNYVRYLNQYAPHTWVYAYWKGDNYGIPTWGSSLGYPRPGIWRMDWLRKVGIDEVPDTLDEMYAALWKFRHEDPDGNGVQDTYGMCPNAQAWFNVFGAIFGAYGVVPHGWMLRDGAVVWGGAQPEAKEVLALLRMWYIDGLIDPDFAIGQIKSSPIPYQKFVSGKTGYFFGSGNYESFDIYNKASLVSVISELQPESEVVVASFPAGPKGIRGARVWSNAAHVFVFGKQVAQKPQKVLRMLKILEAQATDEQLFIETRMGKRGVHWDYDEARGLYYVPPYDDQNTALKHLVNLNVDGPGGFFSPCGIRPEISSKYMPLAKRRHLERYQRTEWAQAGLFGKPDVVPSSIKYLRDLRNLQMTVYAEIVRGDRSVDYFEAFVDEWMERGGAEMTREAQEMYEVQREIYQRVGVVGGQLLVQ